jgi:putative membrane protein insertion efficiency factor
MEIIKRIVIQILKVHKATTSPFLETLFGKGCIYTPTCSEYAVDAIEKHGIVKGTSHAFKRFLRCRPGIIPAYDPVPEEK